MAKYRRDRINDEMQKVLAGVLREVKDPRVRDAFISITGADVTADLKYAKVYYSAMRGEKKEVAKGLASSAGFIRRKVAETMNLRQTPELTFIEDSSIAYGAHISELLHSIKITDPDGREETEGQGNDAE